MRIPPVDFTAIKKAVPITEVLDVLGSKRRRRRGLSYLGPCPICCRPDSRSEKFRTRHLDWYCEGCQRGGDVIRLWALTHSLNDLDAALELCRVFGLNVPRR